MTMLNWHDSDAPEQEVTHEMMVEELAHWLKHSPDTTAALYEAVSNTPEGKFTFFIPKSPMVSLHTCGWSMPAHLADEAHAQARFCPQCGVRRQAES